MREIVHSEAEFDRLYERWNRHTRFYSFWHMAEGRPEYLELLAFGDKAIPWILRRIQQGEHNFFLQVLLGKITDTHGFAS